MPEPDNYYMDIDHFLYIMAQAWGLIMEDHSFFGYPFSYGKLLLYMIAAAILFFAVRKCFFDD